jgi:hypothetical protein
MTTKIAAKIIFFTGFLLSHVINAQHMEEFEDLNKFGYIPENWKMSGSVTTDWSHINFLSTSSGTGILVNQPTTENREHLVSGFEHGDIALEVEFMVPRGSNSGIYLQGRYEIQILDSWGETNPGSGDAGGIYQRYDEEEKRGFEGKPPRTNASKAPGLWQHLKIVFEAPRFDATGKKIKNAKFNQVFLNGVLVHENVEVTGPTRSAMYTDEKPYGPLMIQGDHGPVAIKNFTYKLYDNQVPEIKDLEFAYFKGKFQSEDEFMDNTPDQTGELNKITWNLGHGILDFAYTYSGNLEIGEPGDYTFALNAFGKTSLYINGENILSDEVQFPNRAPRSKTIALKKGSIPFKLVFYKNNYPGRRPQLGFFIEGPGIKKSPLHDSNSYVESVVQKPIDMEPTLKPMVLRGFFAHGEEVKTHTVSVGEPSGPNYVFDLRQGALLGIWKGGFLDTSPMWRGRGQSQLMVPNGALIELSDGPAIAKLEMNTSPWPDSLGIDEVEIQGYTLDRNRRPTFKYILEQIPIEDSFAPEMDGKTLSRTISYSNPQKSSGMWARIISAETIDDIGDGVFYINQGQFYVKLTPQTLSRSVIRDTSSGQELLIPLSTTEKKQEIKYSLVW